VFPMEVMIRWESRPLRTLVSGDQSAVTSWYPWTWKLSRWKWVSAHEHTLLTRLG
jgi:hypothetical protein